MPASPAVGVLGAVPAVALGDADVVATGMEGAGLAETEGLDGGGGVGAGVGARGGVIPSMSCWNTEYDW